MEIMNVIKDLISTVGFPIVAFLLMFKQNQSLTSMITENTKAIEELKDAINSLDR